MRVRWSSPNCDSSVPQTYRSVRNYFGHIDRYGFAKPLANFAGSDGIVEAKKSRFARREVDLAMFTSKFGRESKHLVGRIVNPLILICFFQFWDSGRRLRQFNQDNRAMSARKIGVFKCCFQRLPQPIVLTRQIANSDSIYDHNRVPDILKVLRKSSSIIFGQVDGFAICHHSHKAVQLQIEELFRQARFVAPRNLETDHSATLGVLAQLIGHRFWSMGHDPAIALIAVQFGLLRKDDAQIFKHLTGGSHCAAIVARSLLSDVRNRRWQVVE